VKTANLTTFLFSRLTRLTKCKPVAVNSATSAGGIKHHMTQTFGLSGKNYDKHVLGNLGQNKK
jgi:hypothetical protein